MFTTINAGRFFKILFNALILLILVIHPVSGEDETPDTSLPEQFSDQESFGITQLKPNVLGRFADSEEDIINASTDLSSLTQFTVPAYDTGYYRETGFHATSNLNYLVGNSSAPGIFHNFFVFDLSSITSPVYAVTLRVYNPGSVPDGYDGYLSSDASETWSLYNVDTAIPTLLSGTGGVSAYNDLGSGTNYGDVMVTSAANGTFVEVPLNAFGVAAINKALGDDLAIGGGITTIGGAYDQLLFNFSHLNPQAELIIDTTSPCGDVHGNPINNCSFEGNYNSWTLIDSAILPKYGTWGIATDGQTINFGDSTYDFADMLMVNQGSPGLPHTYIASDGSHLSYHLRNSSGIYRMYQDVTLGYAGDICWDMEFNNHSSNHDAIDQYLAVNIRDLNDTVLTTLYKTTDGVDPLILTPMNGFCFDISAYSYLTVRVDVELNLDDDYFDSAFDNFSIEVNNPPVLDPIGDQVVGELRQLSFTVTASDINLSDTLTFSLNPIAPAGASIDPVTGQFTWTPSATQGPGVYPVTVQVRDDGTPDTLGDKETINITVNEGLFLPISLK